MRELRDYAEGAVEKGALAVILVGSLARGDYTAFSDADITIIIEKTDERPMDRTVRYMEPKMSIDIDLRVYAIKEIRIMIEKRARTIEEIAKHGILLGGDERIIEEIRKIMKIKHLGSP
ncbi:nucleotidyltransferase domain-containing protein [Candidatus Bathyarchaeota archaeon]|nr:nucleotidyltransferase domain-containing protein [Candidatus Bathyarchaeota archaeon]